jgi:flagellar biogenesis protein FliO
MGFSSILDISSFFMGMIINLILVALMCYYFKRKYDYLYEAQCEQSKIIYQLIHNAHKPSVTAQKSTIDFTQDPLVVNRTEPNPNLCSEIDSDSDSDSDESDNDSEDGIEIHPVSQDTETNDLKMIDLNIELNVESNTDHVTVEEVKNDPDPFEITIQLDTDVEKETETNYSKMSMKQLKEVLSTKGIKPKNNIRKEELIELLVKDSSSSS